MALSQPYDVRGVMMEEGLEQAKPIAIGAPATFSRRAVPLPPNIYAGLMQSGVVSVLVAVPSAGSFGPAEKDYKYL
jgi:hypothetical protein